MQKKIFRTLGALSCGCVLQVSSCDSERLGEILTEGVRVVSVDVATFAVDSAVDEIFGLN